MHEQISFNLIHNNVLWTFQDLNLHVSGNTKITFTEHFNKSNNVFSKKNPYP